MACSLEEAPEYFGYSCPFCPVEIPEPRQALSPALVAFEAHLDFHMSRGDQLLAREPYLDRSSAA